MPLDHDVEEHVGRVGAVAEIANSIDDEDAGMRVRRQGIRELGGAKGRGEVVNQGRGGREEGVEAVLNRSIRRGRSPNAFCREQICRSG